MVRRLIRWQLNALERRLGAPVDHLRRLADLSLSAFGKLALIGPAAAHRRAASREMIHAARIAASLHEDCGPCVQMAVNLARHDGVPPQVLQAVLDADSEAMPAAVALAFEFARSVVSRDGCDESWRRQLLEQYGEPVVIELALAVAMARVFPTLKRGMGYATSCSRVTVEVQQQS